MGVDGVLGAGRRGGLRAVAAGAVQRVAAAARRVRRQCAKSQGQLIPGRTRLTGNERPTLTSRLLLLFFFGGALIHTYAWANHSQQISFEMSHRIGHGCKS